MEGSDAPSVVTGRANRCTEEIQDRLTTPAEAVRRFIKDGCQLALGGFTINRNPMAVDLDISRAVQSRAPTADELRILREEVDPQRLILG